MSNTRESGYEVNVANLDVIIESVLGFGPDYNPAKAVLMMSALKGTSDKCKQANSGVASAVSSYKSAVDDREAAFDNLRMLLTRVHNALKASDLTPENIITAKEFVRRAQGKRVSAKTKGEVNGNGSEKRQVSASQMGFDNQIKNASQLVDFLSTKPYKPNESALQVETLAAFLEDLRKKNLAVTAAYSALFDARTLRNDLMFREGTGLVSLARDVKAYVRSLYGPGSPQFKKISGIKFRGIRSN